MDKKLQERLALLEEAEADGAGAFLLVTEEEDGGYRAVHSGRTYTAARLKELHDVRKDIIIIDISGGQSYVPPHPGSNPRGRTLSDMKCYNELVGKQESGETLSPEQEGYLAQWAAEDVQDLAAWQKWDEASRAQFEEITRRMERLNGRAHPKRKR